MWNESPRSPAPTARPDRPGKVDVFLQNVTIETQMPFAPLFGMAVLAVSNLVANNLVVSSDYEYAAADCQFTSRSIL